MNDMLQASSRPKWYQHPLLHFAVFGVAAFSVQAWFAPDEGPPQIVVSEGLIEQLAAEFQQQNARQPSPAEQRELAQDWVQQEMLFREALALQLDDGDPVVRNRMVTKLRSIMSDLESVAEPTTDDLQAIIDADPAAWTLPARVDFEHIFFRESPDEGSGTRDESGEPAPPSATARAVDVLRALRANEEATESGDTHPAGPSFTERTPVQITQTFGARFSRALDELNEGEWAGPLRSDSGLHLVRVTTRHEPRLATVEDASSRLVAAWRQAHAARSQELFMQQLRDRYAVDDQTGLLEGSAR